MEIALFGEWNQKYLKKYFSDAAFQKKIKEEGNYKKTQEKAHSQIETRKYYQTGDIRWLTGKKEWKGLKSIVMEKKTLEKGTEKKMEYRYFISNLPCEIVAVAKAVRGLECSLL